MPQGGRVGRSIAKSQGAFVTPIVTNNPVFQVKLIDVDDKLEQPAAQQKPMKDEVRRGEAVIGTALGKDNKKKHKGIVDNIIKDANGNVTSFTIVVEDGDQIKLDPTSVSRLDLHNDGKNKIAGDDFKVMEKSNKAMSFDAWLAESVNEATAADVSQADHWLKNHATKNPNAGDWNNPKYQSYDYELKDGNKVALMDRGVTIWKFTKKETTMPYRKWFKYVKDIYESLNEGEVKVPKTIKSTSDLEKYFYGLDLKKAKEVWGKSFGYHLTAADDKSYFVSFDGKKRVIKLTDLKESLNEGKSEIWPRFKWDGRGLPFNFMKFKKFPKNGTDAEKMYHWHEDFAVAAIECGRGGGCREYEKQAEEHYQKYLSAIKANESVNEGNVSQ